jgi:exopolysaccharide biosynthesis polyprenyl glycosylphosphotransferase
MSQRRAQRASRKALLIFNPTLEDFMSPGLQPETEGTASLKLVTSSWTHPEPQGPAYRLRPSVARGIASSFACIADLVLLSIILIYFALWAVHDAPVTDPVTLLSMRMSVGHFAVLALCWMAWRFIFSYCGLYTWQHNQSALGVLGRVVLATGISACIAGEIIAVQWHHGHFAEIALYAWIGAAFMALISRVAIGLFHLYVRPLFRQTRHVVMIGSGQSALRVREELRSHPEWDYKILGVVDSTPTESSSIFAPLLGRIGDLEEILMRQVVDEVIVTLPVKSHYSTIERIIAVCERVGVQVQYPEDLFDVSWSNHCHRAERDQQKVVLKMVREDYRHRIKRALDIAGAGFGLILCMPLFLVVAILIKATSKGPVLFRQERYGLGKRTFRIYKFRTMVENAEAAQAALEHMNQNSGPVFKIFSDPRITRVGAFLRKTSIDELPQLFNVLTGEMSLVGPRPLNMRDVGRFSEAWLMRRFSVKPGLTCLWQVSGRSNVSFDRWIALDLHYIDHWSLRMDFKILAMTLPAVVKGTGAA